MRKETGDSALKAERKDLLAISFSLTTFFLNAISFVASSLYIEFLVRIEKDEEKNDEKRHE